MAIDWRTATQAEKDKFYEEEEKKIEKLRNIKPGINIDNVVSQDEVIRIKEEKKRKARELYYNYHRKPSNHPDNWKKI